VSDAGRNVALLLAAALVALVAGVGAALVAILLAVHTL